MDSGTYLALARRVGERARTAGERSEAARRFAVRQVDEGLRDHFLRVSGRAEMDAAAHAARVRQYEGIAAAYRDTARRALRRDAGRAMPQANVELLRQVVTGILRSEFDVPPEYLPERAAGTS